MTKIIKMGSVMDNTASRNQPSAGNLSILTKVDKLRELIGTKVALPQVCRLRPHEKLYLGMLISPSLLSSEISPPERVRCSKA